jgi:hypothetical protein
MLWAPAHVQAIASFCRTAAPLAALVATQGDNHQAQF